MPHTTGANASAGDGEIAGPGKVLKVWSGCKKDRRSLIVSDCGTLGVARVSGQRFTPSRFRRSWHKGPRPTRLQLDASEAFRAKSSKTMTAILVAKGTQISTVLRYMWYWQK